MSEIGSHGQLSDSLELRSEGGDIPYVFKFQRTSTEHDQRHPRGGAL